METPYHLLFQTPCGLRLGRMEPSRGRLMTMPQKTCLANCTMVGWSLILRSVCPDGWEVPTSFQLTLLMDNFSDFASAGEALKDDVWWNGSNSSGFTARPLVLRVILMRASLSVLEAAPECGGLQALQVFPHLHFSPSHAQIDGNWDNNYRNVHSLHQRLRMNRVFTLLLATSCLTAVGQDCSQGCIIPDAVGECFAYDFELNQFPPGQFIQDASTEIENLFINMEHSFMGDLVISFICPNGQSITVHSQGGNGAFLGVPVDNDADPNTPGIGFDYSWDPSATNGTWEDNAESTLPAGSYESYSPFANLDGCPVNGVWQIELCDLWASDNGFVFDFGINFINDFGPGCTDSLACNYNINATERRWVVHGTR